MYGSDIKPENLSLELSSQKEQDSFMSTPRKTKKIHHPVYDTANVKKKIVKIFSDEESDDYYGDDEGKELRVIMVDCKQYKDWMKEEERRKILRRQESKIRGRVRVEGREYGEEEKEIEDEIRFMSNNTVNRRIMKLDLKEVNIEFFYFFWAFFFLKKLF